jgi:hypothetical protein
MMVAPARYRLRQNAAVKTSRRRGLRTLAPLLYVSLVIAGKVFAAAPSHADLPNDKSVSCDRAHAAASCAPRVAQKAEIDGQERWQRPRRTHIATSSSS